MPRTRARGPAALLLLLLAACETPGFEREAAPPAEAARQGAAAPGTVDLSSVGHARGSPDAPVVVVEFSDFGCPYCARFALESLPVLSRDFVASGRVQWRYVPFELGIFPNGGAAALAAECAAEQGRFWEMHDLLYMRQREWKPSDDPAPLFVGYAETAGVSVPGFESCLREQRPAALVARNNEVARRLGVRATPSFLVNGRAVEGALPVDQFRRLLEMSGAGAVPR